MRNEGNKIVQIGKDYLVAFILQRFFVISSMTIVKM